MTTNWCDGKMKKTEIGKKKRCHVKENKYRKIITILIITQIGDSQYK